MTLKEKGQYGLAFGVIAVMLFAVGFPVLLFVFFGVLAFFVWKIFSPESRTETRKIFEFYLSASEILRDDDRRWFGFEVQDVIARGESIVKSMTSAPPLVHFALGALYQRVNDHGSAAKHLSDAVEGPASDELSIVFPPAELREYVRLLRRIERAPAESPLTSAAIRSLERARKNRGRQMLAFSRSQLSTPAQLQANTASGEESHAGQQRTSITEPTESEAEASGSENGRSSDGGGENRLADLQLPRRKRKSQVEHDKRERKTISEVLHDIYDSNG